MMLILNSFLFLLIPSTVTTLKEVCFEMERKALFTFKDNINHKSKLFSSWHGQNCCEWKGVTCNNVTSHVVKLNLSNSYDWNSSPSEWSIHALFGEISPSLLALRHLTHLDLSNHDFSNLTIPNFLGSFENLIHLNLSLSRFRGVIPYELGNLSKLQFLDLGYSQFTGLVPAQLGNLSALQYLSLRNCYTCSAAVDSLSWLYHFPSLKYLDLAWIILNEHMDWSVLFTKMPLLETLILNNCHLSFFPNDLTYVNSTSLKKLDLHGNSFNSKLPNWLWNLTSLFYLDLGYSNFYGRIPSDLRNLASLNYLGLAGPRFPSWLRFQSQLNEIRLSENNITGVIPSWFMDSPVTSLDLSHNNLMGNLPTLSPNIAALDLSNNNISGPFPKELKMPHLVYLLLPGNSLSGSIPTYICDIPFLTLIDLSNNAISGNLPDCWKNNSILELFDVSNNQLSGELPTSIGYLYNLKILQLDNNRLHGAIPSTMQWCTSLYFLVLGRNKFSGEIPKWIGESLLNLVVFQLRSNKFSGCIPPSLGKLANLQVLDLANNSLVGHIPDSVGNFVGMKNSSHQFSSSDLKNDYFHSSDYWSVWIYMDSLYTQMNGQKKLTAAPLGLIKTIDLSRNKLAGQIPEEIWSLEALINLNISQNFLQGGVSEKINGMRSLEYLDLSMNELSGPIPQALSTLAPLHQLNLSYNNFSGRIPTGRQLDTLTDPSIYAGNAYLCGFPTNKNCPENNLAPREPDFLSEDEKSETMWPHLTTIVGFIMGIWCLEVVLIFKVAWRIAYFQIIDNIFEVIYVQIMLAMRRLSCPM
ncbi:hypothetical protein LUZ61_016702 [Rhynchospora tenuis]|uniref:Leucine-rich repeat-containing N-terminal plant-type domain-containing protein n=1 Tax=Rhynchospora tenuis TaxID=198213 RepID=A0AAD5Z618_9POAL|nr:hypothetical protein LUZ61_016702 [Rhynchospora tenuis]